MATDQFSIVLNEIGMISKQFDLMIDQAFLIFSRVIGMMIVAPVFGRKDVPFNIKLGFAMILSLVMVWVVPVQKGGVDAENAFQFVLQIFSNASIGFIIGYIAQAIVIAINSAGSFVNNQVGLSSAMMFDPGTSQQVALMEKFYGFIGLILFFQIGGVYWILSAIMRSFEIFPLHMVQHNLPAQISLDYMVQISGNSLLIGTVLAAPVFVVTMAVDMILGIVNRTAQQIQVFQLSTALKPCIGVAVILVTMQIFVRMAEHYLRDYAHIF